MKVTQVRTNMFLGGILGDASLKNPVRIDVGEMKRQALVVAYSPGEVEVLYREVKDENQPSRGYLNLFNGRLKDEGIWSRDLQDFQEEDSDWGKLLTEHGIV